MGEERQKGKRLEKSNRLQGLLAVVQRTIEL